MNAKVWTSLHTVKLLITTKQNTHGVEIFAPCVYVLNISMKTCTKCNQVKPLEMFSKDKTKKDGRISTCKICHKEYYKTNKAVIIETVRKYQNNNSDKIREYKVQYCQNNKDALKKRLKTWIANNPGKETARVAKYRATKLRATPPWFESDKVNKVYQKAAEWGFEVDHIIPLQGENVCGLHCWANLQLLDKSLNSSKNHRNYPRE